MYEFVKKGAFMLLVAGLAWGTASCDDDDPDYSNVTPPEVAVTHSISGRVTGIDGEGLSATVSMNGTSANDRFGRYIRFRECSRRYLYLEGRSGWQDFQRNFRHSERQQQSGVECDTEQ